MSTNEEGSLVGEWFQIELVSECMVTPAEMPGEDPEVAVERHFARARDRINSWLRRATPELTTSLQSLLAAPGLLAWASGEGFVHAVDFTVDAGWGYSGTLQFRCGHGAELPEMTVSEVRSHTARILAAREQD
jgi:hypothetical protein